MNKLFLIELFGGIGSQAKALKNLGINFEHYRLVEWDKYAIKSYNAIHNTNFTTTDIRQIKGKDLGITNTNQKNYLLTYSFPCTDLSKAGKMKGMSKGSNTRSGLLWEVERLLNELDELPQYLLMENVPDVIGQKNIKDFALWIEFLESKGYKNYYECLNAKDYGIPQNRNRCFMVSFLDKRHFTFPKPFELKLRLKDLLEDEVDEKYFLSDKALNTALNTTYECGKLKNRTAKDGIIPTLCARDYKDPKLVEVFDFRYDEGVRGRIDNSVCPTLTTKVGSKGLSGQPFLNIPAKTKQGFDIAHEGDGVYINRPHQKRGTVQKGMIQTLKTSGNDVGVVVRGNYSPSGHNASRIVDKNGLSPTVMENHGTVTAVVVKSKPEFGRMGKQAVDTMMKNEVKLGDTINPYNRNVNISGIIPTITTRPEGLKTAILPIVQNKEDHALAVRKLTPKECWRLMGFSDDDFDKASKVNSNSQLYKQAGNSIVVNVLEAIFYKIFINTSVENYQTNIFDYL